MSYFKVIRNEEFLGVAYRILRHARTSIDICTFKFEFSKRPDSRGLRDLIDVLYGQAINKIPVRILLHSDTTRNTLVKINEYSAIELAKADIQVKTLPDNRCQHAKMILVDDEIAIIGSHNWSVKSLTENFEISVVIRSKNDLENIKGHFDEIWQKAKWLKGVSKK